MNNYPQSWYDLPVISPRDPRILIAEARINSNAGTFVRSSNFVGAASWVASPFALQGSLVCTALHSDNQLEVADAAQWTIAHQGLNVGNNIPPPVKKIIFLRGGEQWRNTFSINLGAGTYNDLQLSMRDNATSAGDFTGITPGTIPVIQFQTGLTGLVTFDITLRLLGNYIVAISARDAVPNNSMFEMEWIVVR